jgi:hypothetical protein
MPYVRREGLSIKGLSIKGVKHHLRGKQIWALNTGHLSFIGSAWLTIFRVKKRIKLEILRLSNLSPFFFLFRSGRSYYLGKPRKVPVTNEWVALSR